MESKSTLARLYSSEGSVNERHHLSQAICILNDENSKILDCLSTDQFKECIDYLRELILATDLANHFRYVVRLYKFKCFQIPNEVNDLLYRIFKQLKNLTQENLKDNTMLLMSLLITCCDLSDQIKPWPTTHYVAVSISISYLSDYLTCIIVKWICFEPISNYCAKATQ